MATALQTAEILTYAPSLRDLRIERASIERNLGYRRGPGSNSVPAIIEDVLRVAPDLLDLRCGCVIYPEGTAVVGEESASFGSRELHLGGVIAPLLRDSIALALFVATAGPRMERWASELLRGDDPVRGFVADAVASEVVERTAEWLEEQIGIAVTSSGWKLTSRYSPGYCDWPTSDQHTLFSLLPPRFCGIRLNDSALMLPVKSISGIIGLGPDVRREGYTCAICEMQDCFRRRTS